MHSLQDQVSHVSAVEGQSAELPCDVTDSSGSAAGLRLVLWYFAASTIYTYDARGQLGGSTGAHWVNGEAGSRLEFDPTARPAILRISAVSRADAGVYRCRVDYVQAPTRNPRVNLTVVVPPRTPVIFDELGRQTVDDRIGPYREGQAVNVTCAVFEGWPAPAVTWYRDDSPVTGSWFRAVDGSSRSELALGPLTRADLGSRVTCQTTYHASSPPKTATAAIDMILPPLGISMLGDSSPLSAGQPSEVTCRVVGSRPAPEVTWWLNGLQLRQHTAVPVPDGTPGAGDVALSTLTFTPQVKDDGLRLRCQAVNPHLRRVTAEDGRVITVHYPPIVTLTSWPRDNTSVGDTVRMRCNISANPGITDVTWRHDGSRVTSSTSDVTVRNDTLLLRRLRPSDAGMYTCSATNSQGSVTSNAISLQVQHRPMCRTPRRTSQPASRGPSTNVTCPVAAHPPARRYRWALSSDRLGTVPDLSGALLNVSTATIAVPVSVENPLPTLLCWATNALGEQYKPCVINLSPAEAASRPWRPQQCGVTGRSADSIRLTCVPGHDGGRRQTFHVEVFRAADSRRQANVSSTDPSFEVAGLSPGETYSLHVYAMNPLGASTPLTLLARTDGQTDLAATATSATQLAGPPLLGLLGLLLLLAALLALARCWRSRRASAKAAIHTLRRHQAGPSRPAQRLQRQSGPTLSHSQLTTQF
ncbi:Nephrin [Amphibalanus amphitrite]|uniref:Nephrin n=1 Tax=Amphibalanus amphitrite TaxID=1232801 RepID=A0A6A4XG80_AMPAM|nr:Nephrin [Amphibalanus amphitrite]